MLFCSYVKPTKIKLVFCLVLSSCLILSYLILSYSFQINRSKAFCTFHDSATVQASQMAKTLGSTSISHRSDAKVSDKYLIEVNSRVLTILNTHNFANMTCLMPRKLWYIFFFRNFEVRTSWHIHVAKSPSQIICGISCDYIVTLIHLAWVQGMLSSDWLMK